MADYKVTDTELTSVADAIRAKGGTSSPLEWPNGFISAIQAIPTPGPEIVSWSEGTDEQISAMIQAAHAGTIDLQQDAGWAVGDTRTISISAFTGGGGVSHVAQDIDIVITSFDDYMSCGCIMQFDFKNSLTAMNRMNAQGTNVGGYGGSEMKTVTLPALVNALPEWLKSALIEFSVRASAGNSSTTIETVIGNKLALRSEIELFGSATYSVAGEGSHISYYNSDIKRQKKAGNNGANESWWERSPRAYTDQYFGSVASGGTIQSGIASTPKGIAPFGCL